MSTSSRSSTSSSGDYELTLEIVRDEGICGDWLNRYCRNAETNVLSPSSLSLTFLRKFYTIATSSMTQTSKYTEEINTVPSLQNRACAARNPARPTFSSPNVAHVTLLTIFTM